MRQTSPSSRSTAKSAAMVSGVRPGFEKTRAQSLQHWATVAVVMSSTGVDSVINVAAAGGAASLRFVSTATFGFSRVTVRLKC